MPQTDEGQGCLRAMTTGCLGRRAACGLFQEWLPTLAFSRAGAAKSRIDHSGCGRDGCRSFADPTLSQVRAADNRNGARSSRRPTKGLLTPSTPSGILVNPPRTPCARKSWPLSAPAGPRAPTSTSASTRRHSVGQEMLSTERSSPCSPRATSAPHRTARTSADPKELPPTPDRQGHAVQGGRATDRRQRLAVRRPAPRRRNPLRERTGRAQIPALLQRLKDLARSAAARRPARVPRSSPHRRSCSPSAATSCSGRWPTSTTG